MQQGIGVTEAMGRRALATAPTSSLADHTLRPHLNHKPGFPFAFAFAITILFFHYLIELKNALLLTKSRVIETTSPFSMLVDCETTATDNRDV